MDIGANTVPEESSLLPIWESLLENFRVLNAVARDGVALGYPNVHESDCRRCQWKQCNASLPSMMSTQHTTPTEPSWETHTLFSCAMQCTKICHQKDQRPYHKHRRCTKYKHNSKYYTPRVWGRDSQCSLLCMAPRVGVRDSQSTLFCVAPTHNPRFFAWPLQLGLGTHTPRFFAWPLELGLGTHNPRFLEWPLELGLGAHIPRWFVWPL